jgi:hypothetical protein
MKKTQKKSESVTLTLQFTNIEALIEFTQKVSKVVPLQGVGIYEGDTLDTEFAGGTAPKGSHILRNAVLTEKPDSSLVALI